MRIWFVLTSILFIAFLQYSATEICQHFYYVEGFQCASARPSDILAFSAIALAVAFFLPIEDSAESAVIWFVYICHVISASAALPILTSSYSQAYLYFGFCALLFVAGARLVALVRVRIAPPNVASQTVPIATLSLSGLALVVLLASFSISFALPSITDVYDVRDDYKITLQDASIGLIGYLPIWCGYVFAVLSIFFAKYYWEVKRIFSSILCIILAIMLSISVFSLAAFKSVAFIFVVVFILLVALQRRKHPLLVFVSGILGVSIVSAIVAGVGLDENAYYHWIRRVMLAPGMNAAYHLDLFGLDNGRVYSDAPRMISVAFYGTEGSANTGMFGSGLAVFGMFGVIIHVVIFFSYLVILKAVSQYVQPYVGISLILPVAYAFVNSSPTTVIVTYGGALMVVFLWFWGGHSKGWRRLRSQSLLSVGRQREAVSNSG